MKKYKFEVIIHEGADEFWEDITKDGRTGTDELLKEIKEQLEQYYNFEIRLVSFTDDGDLFSRFKDTAFFKKPSIEK